MQVHLFELHSKEERQLRGPFIPGLSRQQTQSAMTYRRDSAARPLVLLCQVYRKSGKGSLSLIAQGVAA